MTDVADVRDVKIAITAHRSDEEPWRLDRLHEVAKDCPTNVIGLRDDEGILSVNWATLPTIGDISAVVRAWCWQSEHLIDHYLKNEAIHHDSGHGYEGPF
jgi:hypothetical protein